MFIHSIEPDKNEIHYDIHNHVKSYFKYSVNIEYIIYLSVYDDDNFAPKGYVIFNFGKDKYLFCDIYQLFWKDKIESIMFALVYNKSYVYNNKLQKYKIKLFNKIELLEIMENIKKFSFYDIGFDYIDHEHIYKILEKFACVENAESLTHKYNKYVLKRKVDKIEKDKNKEILSLKKELLIMSTDISSLQREINYLKYENENLSLKSKELINIKNKSSLLEQEIQKFKDKIKLLDMQNDEYINLLLDIMQNNQIPTFYRRQLQIKLLSFGYDFPLESDYYKKDSVKKLEI